MSRSVWSADLPEVRRRAPDRRCGMSLRGRRKAIGESAMPIPIRFFIAIRNSKTGILPSLHSGNNTVKDTVVIEVAKF